MIFKLKNKLWNQVYETVIDKTPTQSTVILTGSPFVQHPPLVNWRCHHNSAWYLKNNENVVAVAKGFYIDTSGNNPIAHFVCLDSLGNWFDPTLPLEYIKDKKFYIHTVFKSTEQFNSSNASEHLIQMKYAMYNTLSKYQKLLLVQHKEDNF